MTRLLGILLSAWLVLLPAQADGDAQGEVLRVLFVGNSFSFYNNGIHTHFRALLRAAGPGRVAANSVKMATISGGRLEEQAPALDLLLARYAWDVVALQGHSTEAIDPERVDGFRASVAASVERVRDAGARPVLFMTWAYRDRRDMIRPLAQAYREAGAANHVQVVPVGMAFDAARGIPGLELFVDDGKHPTLAGTYLAACTFYTALLGETPVPLDYTAGLEPGLARQLREVAWRSVQAERELAP